MDSVETGVRGVLPLTMRGGAPAPKLGPLTEKHYHYRRTGCAGRGNLLFGQAQNPVRLANRVPTVSHKGVGALTMMMAMMMMMTTMMMMMIMTIP